MDKILIIGSNSFSGSHFANYCLSKFSNVYGISRSNEPHEIYLPYKYSKFKKRFHFIKLDINKNLDKIVHLIKSEKIKYIVNFAAQSMVAESWVNPEQWFQTNVLSQVKFHKKINQLNIIKKFIQISTPEVYGSSNSWKKETFNYNPSTPYATSRAACDMYLKNYFDNLSYPVIFTRAANVYGPGQQLYRIIPRAILFPRLNKILNLDGGGKSKRSFIHIDDVVRATYLILKKGKEGEIYHISTNQIISIKNLIKKIYEINNYDLRKNLTISHERLGKDMGYLLNSEKLRNDFNWSDKIKLDKGLLTVKKWIDKNIDVIKKHNFYYKHKP